MKRKCANNCGSNEAHRCSGFCKECLAIEFFLGHNELNHHHVEKLDNFSIHELRYVLSAISKKRTAYKSMGKLIQISKLYMTLIERARYWSVLN